MKSFETFLQLHQQENPLLIGNCWDVASAQTIERGGYKAIATSSAAVANSMGYEDGEKIPFNLLLQIVERIIHNIRVPFSVDLESGYNTTTAGIINNIEQLLDLGVVGINFEDSLKTEGGKWQSIDEFQKVVSTITNHLQQKNRKLFVNVRTDAFLNKHIDPLTETLKRIPSYNDSGATGIFVPFIYDRQHIKEIVAATPLPVNVLSIPGLPSFVELKDLGVKRISMGTSMFRSLLASFEEKLKKIERDQSFESLF
ncbi:MAG: isocitrate lyase/phosphoenolpyruvate mutase family protein [Chitinophagales bacterium]